MTSRGRGRHLLRAYGRAFRVRWGSEVLDFWREQAREARYSGMLGRVRLALHLLRDAAGSAIRQRLGAGGGPREPSGPRRESLTAVWLRELGGALRHVRRAPAFSTVAALTLGLGIGATMAVLVVVEHVLFRPLDYPDADRLVAITRVDGGAGAVAWPDFADWRESARGFDGMAAWTETSADFSEDGAAVTREGIRATRDLFAVMGVAPMLGRTFTADEDRLGGPDAVILSWGLWQDHFGGDPGAVGRTLRMDGEPVLVVGVMPRDFTWPDPAVEFWQPLREDQTLVDSGLPSGTRTLSFLDVFGRLSEGITREVAFADLSARVRRIDDEHHPADRPRKGLEMVDLRTRLVGDVRGTLLVLLAAAGLVLVVTCANVAGLAVSRSAARWRELAVRSALGAGRTRLFGQLIAEGALLTALGGIVGLAAGASALRAIVALAPDGVPRIESLGLGPPALLAWAGITVLSGVLFALAPAVYGSRMRALSGLSHGVRGGTPGRRELRPQRVLVMLQVALSVVLLAGATLLVRSYATLRAVDPGFTTRGILTASVAPPERSYAEPARTEAFWSELLERVRVLPGVEAATSTYSAPLTGQDFRTTVVTEGQDRDQATWAGSVVVRDDFFSTTGVRLLAGRDFGPGDVLGVPDVAIVSRSMAEDLWPGEDPIGKRFRLAGGIDGVLDSFNRAYFTGWFTVVGVASDVRRARLDAGPIPEYYRPHAQLPWPTHTIIIRVAGDPHGLAAPLRDIVRDIDPDVPVQRVRTVGSQVREALAAPRFRMLLLVVFGGMAGLLAMVGLHAVTALAVARRTRELGIRLALGASRPLLLTHVLRGGLGLVVVGTAIGLVVAFAASRVLTSLLFEIAPADPVTYVLVAAVTAAVGLLACLLPARRASRIDPVRSMQAD